MSETIVLSRQSKLSLVKTVKKVVPPLALVYVIGVQIPLLSPFRSILVDEFIIADSSYALASGHRSVPTLQVWSHIIPAFGAINFHYTPLYFYLSALTFYFLGLAPQSVGVLHFVLRLLSLGVFLLMV